MINIITNVSKMSKQTIRKDAEFQNISIYIFWMIAQKVGKLYLYFLTLFRLDKALEISKDIWLKINVLECLQKFKDSFCGFDIFF